MVGVVMGVVINKHYCVVGYYCNVMILLVPVTILISVLFLYLPHKRVQLQVLHLLSLPGMLSADQVLTVLPYLC